MCASIHAVGTKTRPVSVLIWGAFPAYIHRRKVQGLTPRRLAATVTLTRACCSINNRIAQEVKEVKDY